MNDPAALFVRIGHHYHYLIALAVIVILLWNPVVIVGGNYSYSNLAGYLYE
ncbi:MAG TPA: hypothetical protein VFF53_06410 [Geobacteraceae bacterium]|nr:hypothetical protein [Geobacteraceae bacterium]